MPACFYFDYSSPYAYLASERIAALIPNAEWRPLAFGFLIREIGKTPWSFAADRAARFAEIDARAQALGLEPLRYAEGWPRETWSVLPLRAGLVSAELGRLREYTREAYRVGFGEGRSLADLDAVLDAVAAAGLERDEVRAGMDRPEIKDRLKANTREALELGVTGIPTVAVDGELYWGEDRLDAAAAAAL